MHLSLEKNPIRLTLVIVFQPSLLVPIRLVYKRLRLDVGVEVVADEIVVAVIEVWR
jgi:hypothetical protein